MRANEFVIEGPVDKAGDWMQKQVIGRKQKDQAAAQKQNIPKIAKLLQQNLAAKADQILKKYENADPKKLAAVINNMVVDTLNKSLTKVSGKDKDVTEDVETSDLTAVADAVLANPTGIATDGRITQLIQQAVTKTFSSVEPDADVDPDAEEPGPGTKKRLQKFDAEVFYPQGNYDRNAEGEQLAYVNREGKWSLFRMAERHQWEFVNAVSTDEEQAAIEKLIRQQKLQPIPQTFKYKKQDYYRVN